MTDLTNTPRTSLVIPALGRLYLSTAEVGEAVVRLAAGLFLVPHALQKLFGVMGGYGLEGTAQYFETQLGFENGFLVVLTAGLVELIGGLMLAFGLGTRIAAGAIAVFMIVAASVHVPAGFFWTNGGWEFPVFWGLVAAMFVGKGGGRYSIDGLIGREV